MQWNTAAREVPEIVLDFQGLLRSALISFARGSRPIIGLSDAREGASGFYDHIIPVDAGAHAVDRYLELPRALGVPVNEVIFPLPAGAPIEAALPPNYVLVHPYSRGAGKSLGAHELQVLCDCLTTATIVIIGVSRDATPVRGSHVIDLTNQTSIAQLIALMRGAAAVVSVDSGPMHIAAAVNDNTLGLHTWSDPRKVGPYNPKAWVWKAGRIAHRGEFTAEECVQTQPIHEGDARRIADFVMA
jgi:ADP-heptose:LPS heptosyltransferase